MSEKKMKKEMCPRYPSSIQSYGMQVVKVKETKRRESVEDVGQKKKKT
jgi:hypothetical protein